MKKILLSVTFLLMLVSITNAADKKQTAVNNTVENTSTSAVTSSSVAVANYAAVLVENTKLRMQAAELTVKMDDLASKLDYTQMMHVTISNLKDVSLVNTVENAKFQMDYARLMNAVLVNLVSILGNRN